MDVLSITKDKVILELSIEELTVLGNALKETYDYLEEWEFETRMGFTYQTAAEFINTIASIKESMPKN